MKMDDRLNLAETATQMADFPALDKKQSRAVAKVLDATARYFEKNPHRWIANAARVEANSDGGRWMEIEPQPYDRYCAIGVWEYVPSALPAKAVETLQAPAPGYSFMTIEERASDNVVEMNDGMSCVESVVEGLRTQAAAFQLAGSGMEWSQAIKMAFAKNAHLLQVQQARKAKRSSR